jgi:hypothetical protein
MVWLAVLGTSRWMFGSVEGGREEAAARSAVCASRSWKRGRGYDQRDGQAYKRGFLALEVWASLAESSVFFCDKSAMLQAAHSSVHS